MLKIAIVTNLIAPYRVPIYSQIARRFGVRLHVFLCANGEPYRDQDLPSVDFDFTIVGKRHTTFNDHYIHSNFDVIEKLKQFCPDVIVTDGFTSTHLYALSYALVKKIPHVSMTDGVSISERVWRPLHRAVRRFVYSTSTAFIAASRSGQVLYEHYGIPSDRCFTSCLCADNKKFFISADAGKKQFDFIFSGRIEPVKNPIFALEVCVQLAKKLRRKIKILFVGSGEMEEEVKSSVRLFPGLIEAEFHEFSTQAQLPALYQSARLFLIPSLSDPWDVVANEACAAGLPVIASPFAAVANELVRDGENGFICDLDANLWANKAEFLLTHPESYRIFSERSQSLVNSYNYESAAVGLVAASQFAISPAAKNNMKNIPIKSKPRVVIVERQLLNYRVGFYNRLRTRLEEEGIELQLLIGTGTPEEEKKMDQVLLDWAIQIPTRYFLGSKLCWQPFGAYARNADLVIVMHENKIIYNLWLLSFGRPKRLAFWGHGKNMQSDNPDGLKERFKRWTVNKVDWWFAYTESSAELVTNAGFPRECTTVVENAIDTEEMTAFCKQVTSAVCQRKRDELKLGDGPIALYLGSLYKEKRLDFLLDAAYLIRERIPNFQLLVVGAGPDQAIIENAASEHNWIHYLGPLQDKNKAVALVLADVMLNPGLVGLGILDSFASGTPMFTTDCGLHSPEISYMTPGKNGVITRDDVNDYANTVVSVLQQPEAIARLSRGALSSAPRYTVENMAERILNGICSCLSTPQTMPKGIFKNT
ncbi:MAG: glycosyltransferase family 4 protein [Burkholderiaceae bacterium]